MKFLNRKQLFCGRQNICCVCKQDICCVSRQDICCVIVSADISQGILSNISPTGAAAKSADTMTQQMSCLLTQQMSCLQKQQMSCLQTHFLPKIPHPGFARFGTSKMESGHHLDISGDLPAIFVGVVLTF